MSTNDASRSKEGKLRLTILPLGGLSELMQVAEFGAKKHGELSYKQGFPVSYYINAAFRHIFLQWLINREDRDKESGISHLAHGAWNILAALEQMQSHPELDDRYRAP